MDQLEHTSAATTAIVRRTLDRYERYRRRTLTAADRLFAWTLLVQWAAAIAVALVVSPWAWPDEERALHTHAWLALVLGGAIVSAPVAVGFLGVSCTRRSKEWLAAAEEGGLIEAMAESEWRRRSVLERAARPTDAERWRCRPAKPPDVRSIGSSSGRRAGRASA